MKSWCIIDSHMSRRKGTQSARAQEVARWFARHVTYEGEAYTIDAEQAEVVADESQNTIVVARAGSGKTRTIVAKMVWLIAQCGVRSEEIMAFVFNANAAAEINARLSKMLVDGEPIVEKAKVASTFHAFSRKVVFDVCGGKERCGKILAGEKEAYLYTIVVGMMRTEKWQGKIVEFIKGAGLANESGERKEHGGKLPQEGLEEREVQHFARMMALFVNRAQQKLLGGNTTLGQSARGYLKTHKVARRERLFVELGVECYRRYHWYLLDERGKSGLLAIREDLGEYGTDFNLIVSWAAQLIGAKRGEVRKLIGDKKYILIDEYQDFSQLFLSVVKQI